MLSGLLGFLRPAHLPDWTLAEREAVRASENLPHKPLCRTPYPWLADAKPLPPRTGRAPLRLVVSN